MLSPLRNRFGIPGVISVIALVFAMLGGAYAANNSGSGKATASAKGKQGPRGKTGKTGPAGPAGPAGPTGPAGANGKDGANGANGSNGKDGTNGTGVTTASFAGSKGTCDEEQGGLEVKSASPAAFVCNGLEGEEGEPGEPGEPGEDGKEGSPWTLGGTLPPGKTETGAWAFTGSEADTAGIRVPISFPVQFPFVLQEAHVHFSAEGGFGALCPGSSAAPKAEPGELCVYLNGQEALEGTSFQGIYQIARVVGGEVGEEGIGANRGGAMLLFTPPTGPALGSGSFAVTGCTKTVGEPNECPKGS